MLKKLLIVTGFAVTQFFTASTFAKTDITYYGQAGYKIGGCPR